MSVCVCVCARVCVCVCVCVHRCIGNSRALAQVEVAAQDKRLVAFNQAGIAGWLLWRSVYLTKQVAFRNRVLVLFDWLKSRVFGRDIACL